MPEPSYVTRTRAGYDAVAVEYAEWVRDELGANPLGRSMLGAFAEMVRESCGAGQAVAPTVVEATVLEVGCGPGRVTSHLQSLGLAVSGIDLSPAMVALARTEHPGIQFDEGSMTALGSVDGALAGLVAWYSIIHLPPADLPQAFAEFHRVLVPGGHLLLAFQMGDEPRRLEEAFGRPVSLEFHRLSPDRVEALLIQAGFELRARLTRPPEGQWDSVPQAHLIARKRNPQERARDIPAQETSAQETSAQGVGEPGPGAT